MKESTAALERGIPTANPEDASMDARLFPVPRRGVVSTRR